MRTLPLLFAALAKAFSIPAHVFHPQETGHKGGVASENAECSRIGRDALAIGGNAVDAMVATTVCIGVMAPYHAGFGGGGFAIVRDQQGEYEVINFRETAPGAAYEDMFEGNLQGSITSGLSVAVPGEARGLEYMHKRYGRLPWRSLIEPSIDLARDGFRVSEDMWRYMNVTIAARGNFILEDPAWAAHFAPDGKILEVGDVMYRKNYANTLEAIADHGADAFYTGPLASAMIKTIQSANGTMTLADLATYEAKIEKPLSVPYRGYKLHTTGVPSSGAVLTAILKTMEQYPASDWESDEHLSVHRLSEAMRFAYGARLELGDPEFVPGARAMEDRLLSEEVARAISEKILDDRTQPVEVYDPRRQYTVDSHGTSHLVSADMDGVAVSLTTTINLLFGSLLMDPVTGVVFNNHMNDFSIPNERNEFGFEPSEANFIRPHKRPLSSSTPVIIEAPASPPAQGEGRDQQGSGPDFNFHVAIGAAGGSRIISATAQTIWHLLEHGIPLEEAMRRRRLHDQLMPNHVTFEHGFDEDVVESMRDRGHEVVWVAEGQSAVQGVRVSEEGEFKAVGEPRQKNSGGMTA